MAATKRQMNWTAVGFTPTSGSLTTATGVTSVKVDTGGSLVKFSGDGDRGPSTVVNDFNEPTIEVSTADIAWAMALSPGTTGALTATHNDAKLATLGAIVYALSPCIVEKPSADGEHRQIGKGMAKFVGIFSDGQTNPLSFTRS
jgi:hypothetical protein